MGGGGQLLALVPQGEVLPSPPTTPQTCMPLYWRSLPNGRTQFCRLVFGPLAGVITVMGFLQPVPWLHTTSE